MNSFFYSYLFLYLYQDQHLHLYQYLVPLCKALYLENILLTFWSTSNLSCQTSGMSVLQKYRHPIIPNFSKEHDSRVMLHTAFFDIPTNKRFQALPKKEVLWK